MRRSYWVGTVAIAFMLVIFAGSFLLYVPLRTVKTSARAPEMSTQAPIPPTYSTDNTSAPQTHFDNLPPLDPAPAEVEVFDGYAPPAGRPTTSDPPPAANGESATVEPPPAANGESATVESPPAANGEPVAVDATPAGRSFAINVFFATDRNRIQGTNPAILFGNGRGNLSYGYCEVSIPRDHRMGVVERPSLWRLEFNENPDNHVVILRTIPTSKGEFFTILNGRIVPPKSEAFLFVHGYNVPFDDAARRTAQISYDLGFQGAPVFYSWPSQGSTAAYTVDEQNIEWAQANMLSFLKDFFARSNAQHIYLIAHSMGNRGLTRALISLLADNPEYRSRLKEVILTAPDIDSDVFKRDIAPALAMAGRPVTLYASSNDLALVASKQVHGYARAGDSGQGLVVVEGIETIDASNVDTSLLGHSYFAETRTLISDMFYLIGTGNRADKRFGLRRIDAQGGKYWMFKD